MFSVQSQDGGAAKRRSKSRPSKAQLAALAKGRKALAAKRRKCNRLLKASQKGGASPGMAKFKAAAKMAGSMAKRSAQKAAVLAKAGAVKGARAATASARNTIQIPWVAGWSVRGIFGRGTHGELIEVQPPGKDCSRLLEFSGYGCVVGRNVVFQNPAGCGQGLPLDADDVLQPNGNSIQRAL